MTTIFSVFETRYEKLLADYGSLLPPEALRLLPSADDAWMKLPAAVEAVDGLAESLKLPSIRSRAVLAVIAQHPVASRYVNGELVRSVGDDALDAVARGVAALYYLTCAAAERQKSSTAK